ncbi:anti-sigma-I factor RsgI family protein [Neobacillus sp. LXY-4]|uniref:anti-sigma factor domain-containing protein n=1 Tax=Neobacillus sp. LXY-4 TaxID=3379826 RepID=UPI003EDEC518
MKTGIILEIDDRFLTILTPDGQFMRAGNHKSQYQIGQEIQFIPLEEEMGKTAKMTKWFTSFKGKALTAAVLAMLIGAATFIPAYNDNQVFAYMSLDNESSLELEVNKALEVIGIHPYNNEGEKIINMLGNWKKQDLSVVSEKILSEMKKQGFGDGEIILSSTVIADSNKKSNRLLNKELSNIKEIATKQEASITVVKGTEEERKQATDKGVTVGQLKQEEIKVEEDKSNNKQTKSDKKEAVEKEKQEEMSIETVIPENQQNTIDQPPLSNIAEMEKKSEKLTNENKQNKKEVQSNNNQSSKAEEQSQKQQDKNNKQIEKNK